MSRMTARKNAARLFHRLLYKAKMAPMTAKAATNPPETTLLPAAPSLVLVSAGAPELLVSVTEAWTLLLLALQKYWPLMTVPSSLSALNGSQEKLPEV